MAMLTREQITQAQDIQEETVLVPEWGGELRLRGLTLLERSKTTDAAQIKGKISTLRAAIWTFCFGVQEPRFDPVRDFEMLCGKSAVVERIAMRIMKLSGTSDEDLTAAIKNSESDPNAA